MAHRPFEQDVGQPLAVAEGHMVHLGAQPRRAPRVGAAVGEVAAVLGQAQADGVGPGVPMAQQATGFGHVAIGAEAAHLQLLAEQLGAQREVLLAFAQADADHLFHLRASLEG